MTTPLSDNLTCRNFCPSQANLAHAGTVDHPQRPWSIPPAQPGCLSGAVAGNTCMWGSNQAQCSAYEGIPPVVLDDSNPQARILAVYNGPRQLDRITVNEEGTVIERTTSHDDPSIVDEVIAASQPHGLIGSLVNP